jgi:hypothetical protein
MIEAEIVAVICVVVIAIVAILALLHDTVPATGGQRSTRTSKARLATVQSTCVVIITVHVPGTCACAVDAAIAYGAYFTIIAGCIHGRVCTANAGVATVVCTDLVIIAIEVPGSDTGTRHTAVTGGAEVPIVAIPFGRIVKAMSIITTTVHGTVFTIVAFECGPRHTVTVRALIVDGAIVAVIARSFVKAGDLTAQLHIAGFVRTQIVVVTSDGGPQAHALSTRIQFRAVVVIIADTARDGFEGTPVRAHALVLGTGVSIITKDLIDEPITVVVDAITYFRGRRGRITLTQAVLATNPLTRADSKFIVVVAAGRQGQRRRSVRTLTDPCLVDTLTALTTLDRAGHLTEIAFRTGMIVVAGSAAEGSFQTVIHA